MHCLHNVVQQFWDQTLNGITSGSIYAMIALGYTMVYGVLQLINFAHSEVFMVATVITLYSFRNWWAIDGPLGGIRLIVVLFTTLLACMAFAGLTAVTLERFAYRPLRRRRAPRLAFLISAIGASLAIQYLFVLMDGQHYLLFFKLPALLGPNPQSVPTVMKTSKLFTVFGTTVTNLNVMVVFVALAMLFLLDRFVRGTRVGKGIRAVAQDAETASMMGVNVDRIIVTTFLIGGLMAGAAGMLYIVSLGVPSYWFIGFLPGLKAFTAAVLGGIGNIRGAMLGGLLLGIVEAHGTACAGPAWTNVIAFVVLVGVLMLRPTGLLGERVGN